MLDISNQPPVTVQNSAQASHSAAESTHPAIAAARSVPQLIDLLKAMDEDVIVLTPAEMEALGSYFRDKVDELKLILDIQRARALLWRERANAFTKAADESDNAADTLENLVKEKMVSEGMQDLPGKDWRAKLVVTKQNRTVIGMKKPTLAPEIEKMIRAEIPLHYDPAFADFLRVSISIAWDATEIKRFIKNNPDDRRFDGKVALEDSTSLRWTFLDPVKEQAKAGQIIDAAKAKKKSLKKGLES